MKTRSVAQKFPSIRDVARQLALINANVEGWCDVRLQVYPRSSATGLCPWIVRSGDSSYDLDHTGYWGSATVPGVGGPKMRPRRFNAQEMARKLLDQVKDQWVEWGLL